MPARVRPPASHRPRWRSTPAIAPLRLPGVPAQTEIDRPLSAYEALVQVDVALEEAVAVEVGR